jgi:hypothetical protein
MKRVAFHKHPISFTFSQLAKLRRLAKNIKVVVEGIAESPAYIDQIEDVEEHLVNSGFLTGNAVAIHGHKIKIDGTAADCGVYFVPANDPFQAVKVSRILENNPSRVLVIALASSWTVNRIGIRTQHSGGGILLATPRTIISPFTIEQM